MRTNKYTYPSLLNCFDPPEGYRGIFGFIFGYSADQGFLNMAIERFTGISNIGRLHEGDIQMLLMLDKGNPQISFSQVPGLLHAGIKQGADKLPFKLLHAKIALLHFADTNTNDWKIRLLVSTGNWTLETLRNSLDLFFQIELSNEDINSKNIDTIQNRVDVFHSWNLTKWLLQYFDIKILQQDETQYPVTSIRFQQFYKQLESLQNSTKATPRFFDNRRKSLLQQIPEILLRKGSLFPRNYLALGSGFYQSLSNKEDIPLVVQEIFDLFKNKNLIKKNHLKDIYVNPESCQGISTEASVLIDEGWMIRNATDPIEGKRSLHAKFIFSANEKLRDNTCYQPWLYMGSGNLTKAGFLNKISPFQGNLEAGVIIIPDKLYWEKKRDTEHNNCVETLLPMQWDLDFNADISDLKANNFDGEFLDNYSSGPISWLSIIWDQEHILLKPDRTPDMPVYIIATDGSNCKTNINGEYEWSGVNPSEVLIQWGSEQECSCKIPVLDSFGKMNVHQSLKLQVDEIWMQLESFPAFNGSEDENESNYYFEGIAPNVNYANFSIPGKYPIRVVMELIERIAEKQTKILQHDWLFWCSKVERVFISTKESPVYEIFRKMNLNPLSALRNPSFRPDYAEDGLNLEGRRYEQTLDTIESSLELKGLFTI